MDTLNHEKSNNLVPDQVANPQLDNPLTQLRIDAGIVALENQQVDHMGLKKKKNVVSDRKVQICILRKRQNLKKISHLF